MTIGDIKTLIASDESRTLELEKTTGVLKDDMYATYAFMNSGGGSLIFGVTPMSLRIVGHRTPNSNKD